MAHEGIKFRNAADTQEVQRQFSAEALTPKGVRVNLTSGTGVDIDWKDGHRSEYTFRWLRDACPCAHCNELRTKEGRAPGDPEKQSGAPSLLPMYKEPAKPEEATPVGRYAISFRWNDGHQHGIYSWEYLRANCPCEQCRGMGAAEMGKEL